MLKWIITIVILVSSAILAYMYVQLEQLSATPEIVPVQRTSTVRITDAYRDGIHRFSGQVRLVHSCFTLEQHISVNPEYPTTAIITLTSKDRMLDEKLCAQIPTSYPFQDVYDGPEDMDVKLILDGVELPVRHIKTVWQNPSGNVINPID